VSDWLVGWLVRYILLRLVEQVAEFSREIVLHDVERDRVEELGRDPVVADDVRERAELVLAQRPVGDVALVAYSVAYPNFILGSGR